MKNEDCRVVELFQADFLPVKLSAASKVPESCRERSVRLAKYKSGHIVFSKPGLLKDHGNVL